MTKSFADQFADRAARLEGLHVAGISPAARNQKHTGLHCNLLLQQMLLLDGLLAQSLSSFPTSWAGPSDPSQVRAKRTAIT